MSVVDPSITRPRPAGVLRAGGGFRPFAAADVLQSIPDRFESQAALHPDRIAVTALGQRLTYGELDVLADRVALGLLARGVAPGDRVALALDHEPAALAALLGVLKAGAVVTALDPTWPEPRSAAIVGDAEPRLLVTSAAHRGLGERLASRAVRRELPSVVTARAPGRRPAIPPDALAFLLYTSGTTGPPKGVMRTHGAQLRSARGDINFFQIGPEDRITLFASLAAGHSMSVMGFTLLKRCATWCRSAGTPSMRRGSPPSSGRGCPSP